VENILSTVIFIASIQHSFSTKIFTNLLTNLLKHLENRFTSKLFINALISLKVGQRLAHNIF